MLKVLKSKETLDKLIFCLKKEDKCAYVRTGDGDIRLLNGEDDSYNKCTPKFQEEMEEVFSINDITFMKCLPLYIDDNAEPNMSPGNHLCDQNFYNYITYRVKDYLQYFPEIYSHVALCYQATYNPEYAITFLKHIKKACLNYPTYIIGNKNTNKKLLDLFFGSKYTRIETLCKNSYSDIDYIWNKIQETINPEKYTIFIIFMGCAGRPLQKRIWKQYNKVFLFDVGSLMDAINQTDTRAWIKISGFNSQSFLELCKKGLDNV